MPLERDQPAWDPRLEEAYGPDAQPVDHNAPRDLRSNFQAKHDRLWFNPAVSGTHHIEVRGAGGTGRHSVSVTDVDIGENRNTKGRIAVDGDARSRVNYDGDGDGVVGHQKNSQVEFTASADGTH